MTVMGAPCDVPTWWASLKHGGMLIAPARLFEHFALECGPLSRQLSDHLRRDWTALDDNGFSASSTGTRYLARFTIDLSFVC
jgi:hypothetical protein